MNGDTSRSANLRVNMKWLGLTLSARMLARELLRHADAEGFIALRAEAVVDPAALADELARLLCAHRREGTLASRADSRTRSSISARSSSKAKAFVWR